MPRKSKTTKDQDRKLIEAVKNHKCLYDKAHTDYRNTSKIAEEWRDIAKELPIRAIEPRKRWRQLRDNYVRKKKDNDTSWEHYDLIKSFLDPSPDSQSSTESDTGNGHMRQNVDGEEDADEEEDADDDESPCDEEKCELIEAVKSHPCLYNPGDPDFGDISKYYDAWESVAHLHSSFLTLVNWHWQLLRDKYIRKKKENNRMWKYNGWMSFLDPSLRSQSSTELNTGNDNMRQNLDEEKDADDEIYAERDERLIQAVQPHPSVYDPEDRYFGDRTNAEKVWKSIAAEINDYFSARVAHYDWQRLRNKYIRKKKENDTKWIHYERMSFLDPFLATESRIFTTAPGRTCSPVEDDGCRPNLFTACDVNVATKTDNVAKRPLPHQPGETLSSAVDDFYQSCAKRSKLLPSDVQGYVQIQISQVFWNAENRSLPQQAIMAFPQDHERSSDSATVLQTATLNTDASQTTAFNPNASQTATLNANVSQTPSSYLNAAQGILSQTATVPQTPYSNAIASQHFSSTSTTNSVPSPQTELGTFQNGIFATQGPNYQQL